MPKIKITKEINIIDNFERYFLHVDNKFITGAETLEEIEQIATAVIANNGDKVITETIKEYTC